MTVRLSTEAIENLRRLAERATPGEWVAEDEGVIIERDDRTTRLWIAECDPSNEGSMTGEQHSEEDAAFIAAANPSVVASLAEEVLRLRKVLHDIVIAVPARLMLGATEDEAQGIIVAVERARAALSEEASG